MNIEFVINDYLLAWYLLFNPSVSEEIQTLKERLWKNYSKQYMDLQKEKVEILKYTHDFIPDDDTVYNLVFTTDEFKKIKKETEKHRQYLMKMWDQTKKKVQHELPKILRFPIENKYQVLVVYPELDLVEFLKTNPKKNIVWGKKEDTEDGLKAIARILFTILKYEIGNYQSDNKEIVASVIDLAIMNELYTKVSGQSKYNEGMKKIFLLKKQIYPYWLMYLGAEDRETLVSYMMRDALAFDMDSYPIEKKLKKCDLYGFIDFCCQNQNKIIRLTEINIE